MEASSEDRTGRHELVVAAVALVGLARLVEGPAAWVVVGLVLVAVIATGAPVLGGDGRRLPVERLLVPAVLTVGAAGAIRLVPVGLGLVPALALFALLLDRVLGLELRLLHQPAGATVHDRSRVMLAIVVAGFAAFSGLAALVPGGLAEAGGPDGGTALSQAWLLALALGDGTAAALLGYRASSFRDGRTRVAVLSAVTYGVVIAVAAGGVRAIDLPRLVGPALLALVLYLWDAVHAGGPARRREPRFLWETALLMALGAVVVAWNLQLRG